MKKDNELIKNFIFAIYPNKCICCGEIITEGIHLCENCNNNIERLNLDDICLNCGLEKCDCECKYSIYRFRSLVGVFKNCGLARKAYYSYKFAKKECYSYFFAEEMCNAVNKCYNDVKFDIICTVPQHKKHSYDHSGYITEKISQKLDVPFLKNLLICVKKSKSQHKSTIKERLSNVNNKYKTTRRIDGMNVLLIDDIKTTGATLDECAKILLFAGAENVYCACALVTVIENEN